MKAKDVWVRYDEKRGVWWTRYYLGTNKVTHKQVRKYESFPDAENESDALAMARRRFRELEVISKIGTSTKVADVLDSYMKTYRYAWTDNTVRTYETCAKWVKPYIGKAKVAELSPTDVMDLYSALRTSGAVKGGGLSSNSVMRIHMFLRKCFKWLVSEGVIPSSPFENVDKPPIWKVEASALSDTSLAVLKSWIAGVLADDSTDNASVSRRTYAFAAYLALNTGMRVGETCALSVGDAWIARGMVRVNATVVEKTGESPYRQDFTKGKKSRNVQIGRHVCAAIADHIAWQRTYLPKKAALDEKRTLICTKKGGIVRPSTVSRAFSATARNLGLPQGTTFHTLRHTHATFALASNGGDFRTVQERLGHSDPATTIRLYTHVIPGRDAQVAAELDEMMGGEL